MANRRVLDVFDEEFLTNLEIAKNLLERVRNPTDRDICKKWISKLVNLKATDVCVKKNRNSFFKYFLQVLYKGVQGDEFLRDSPLDDKKAEEEQDDRTFTCRWSEDKRTYIAAKPLPGKGTLVYMAVAKDPTLGWDKHSETTYS